MTTPHKATLEQWALIASDAADCDLHCLCLLDLRDRIAALEAAANRQAILDSSPAPAGGLVEELAMVIDRTLPCADWPVRVPKTLLKAVASYLEDRNDHTGARWIRDEVEAAE